MAEKKRKREYTNAILVARSYTQYLYEVEDAFSECIANYDLGAFYRYAGAVRSAWEAHLSRIGGRHPESV